MVGLGMKSRKVLVDLLLASGVSSEDEATLLAGLPPANGNTWTTEVLNTGKVDEQKFAAGLAELFKSKVASVEAAKIDRGVLGLLPSRFVFKHQILPLEANES